MSFFRSQDISDIALSELQGEVSPRISANDLIDLIFNGKDAVAILDLRGSLEFSRMRVAGSINIPFTTVLLGDTRLESLGVPNLESILADKIVVIVSVVHENAVLVSAMKRSRFSSILRLLFFFITVLQISYRLWCKQSMCVASRIQYTSRCCSQCTCFYVTL